MGVPVWLGVVVLDEAELCVCEIDAGLLLVTVGWQGPPCPHSFTGEWDALRVLDAVQLPERVWLDVSVATAVPNAL